MDERRLIDRVPVFTITIAALVIAALLGIYMQQGAVGGESRDYLSVDLTDHNKNDGKDGCPQDGNAGSGNDDKGPGGGCRPPHGQYGQGPGNGNNGNNGNACTHRGKGRPPFCP